MSDEIPLPEALNELAKMQRVLLCFARVSGVLQAVPTAQQLLSETVAAQAATSAQLDSLKQAVVTAQAEAHATLAGATDAAAAIRQQASADADAILAKANADAEAALAAAYEKAKALVLASDVTDASLAVSNAALEESKALLAQSNAQLADAQAKLAQLLNVARQGLGQ